MFELFHSGGFIMYPLFAFSLIVWAVIFERLWRYHRLGRDLRSFQLEAMNALLQNELERVRTLCAKNESIPTARILMAGMERLQSRDARLRSRWLEALERRRQVENQDLRQYLWMLGTIGSASPFVGLFGTVLGILKSFNDIARTGQGGFAIVAAGISEALIATAAGIIVAVVAVLAFNSFQTRWSSLVLTVRLHSEELAELLAGTVENGGHSAASGEGRV